MFLCTCLGVGMIAIAPLLLCLLSALVEVHSITAPYLTINGKNIPNNSYVDFNTVGTNIENQKSNTLQCNTDLNTCCSRVLTVETGTSPVEINCHFLVMVWCLRVVAIS